MPPAGTDARCGGGGRGRTSPPFNVSIVEVAPNDELLTETDAGGGGGGGGGGALSNLDCGLDDTESTGGGGASPAAWDKGTDCSCSSIDKLQYKNTYVR